MCQTTSVLKTYTINNDGIDPNLGKGYAWSDEKLMIDIGDTITWSWSSPIGISDATYRVAQLQDAESFIESGFSSGFSSTPSGTYTRQFQTPGTYYYWSGYIDNSKTVSFRGYYNAILSFYIIFNLIIE